MVRGSLVAMLGLVVACGSGGDSSPDDAATRADASSDAGKPDAPATDGSTSDAGADVVVPPPVDKLQDNRDRLLATYFAYLKSSVTTPQSNGLSGSNVTRVCDVWQKMDLSAQTVFLTITARLQGGLLGVDGSSMLFHVTKLYRIAGGQGASGTNNPGSCGGAEYNRLIMAHDVTLHTALIAANSHKGNKQGSVFDIADIPQGESWRNSTDLGGPHAPFDLSDETNPGAPRGQVHFFVDPTSTLAKTALGRMDVTTLVEPYALEMDQDYNCTHDSNPRCTYVTYGTLCIPQPSKLGADLYTQNYGTFDPNYAPADCGK